MGDDVTIGWNTRLLVKVVYKQKPANLVSAYMSLAVLNFILNNREGGNKYEFTIENGCKLQVTGKKAK